jgi:hypothetical protein
MKTLTDLFVILLIVGFTVMMYNTMKEVSMTRTLVERIIR